MLMFFFIVIQPALANTTTVYSTSYTTIQITVSPVAVTTSVIATGQASSSTEVAAITYMTSAASSSVAEAESSSEASSTCDTSASASYSAPVESSAAPVESSAAPASSAPATTSVAPVLTASSTEVASSASTVASSSASPSASSVAGTSGTQWCMTYSPYTSSGTCKDQSSQSADIAEFAAKGFSSVRLYSTDCNGLTYAANAAKALGLKLVLGIFISDSGISAAGGQITDITSWASGDYSAVEMIVVGNEAIFNGYCDAGGLATFISSAKSTFQAAGYTGPVTTTEPMDVLQSDAATLCPVIDVLASNIHAFFNTQVTASEAGTFVASTLEQLAGLCPGDNKAAYNLESGWPSAGDANGAAIPGEAEQATAIAAIRETSAGKTAFFSFENDMWKAPGPLGVEQSWGCAHLFEGN